MNLFWIVIGTLALGAPHIASVGTDGMMAWPGLPFPGECAALLLAIICLYLVGIPKRWRSLFGPVTLSCAFVMLVCEFVCALFGEGSLGGFTWSAADEALHVAASALWIMNAVCDSEDRGERPVSDALSEALVVAALCLSGAVWYLTTAAVRYAIPAWTPAQEMLLWGCALLWAAPLATLFRTSVCTKPQLFIRAAAPVAGILLANRTWVLALTFGLPVPVVSSIALALLAGPVFSLSALLIAWLGEERAEQAEAVPEEPTPQPAPTGTAAQLPLHLIPGYQALSERERAVLLQTLDGATATTIAAELGISDATVRTYRARAYEKMNVSGAAELLAAVRMTAEQPFPLPEEPDAELSPAVRTIPERLLPPLACVLTALVAVFALLMLRKLPSLVVRELVPCALFVAAAAFGLVKLHTDQEEASPHAVALAICAGAAAAIVAAALLFGPEAYLLRRTLVGIAALVALIWLVYRARPLWGGAPYLAIATLGIVGAACVPPGVRVQDLVHSTTPFIYVLACIAIAALALSRMLNDVEALLAAATLVGDERVLAYLHGRGVNDIMAQVALLTARDFPLGGIAATVQVSRSTVAKYRSRAYNTLGVSGKEELTSLLEREAGFVLAGGVHDVSAA